MTDWLTEQMEEQRKRVQESQVTLQRYREANDALAVEDRQNIVVQKLAELNGIATRAKSDRIQKEAAFRQLESLQAKPDGVYEFPAIVANERIQLLRSDIAQIRRQQAQLAEELGCQASRDGEAQRRPRERDEQASPGNVDGGRGRSQRVHGRAGDRVAGWFRR